jgi:excisionase family DNA binding protein
MTVDDTVVKQPARKGAPDTVSAQTGEVTETSQRFAPPGLRSLSRLSQTYLQLVCQGVNNAEIARHFGVSEQTVKNNMTALMRRMGARNRAHAVYIYLKDAAFTEFVDQALAECETGGYNGTHVVYIYLKDAAYSEFVDRALAERQRRAVQRDKRRKPRGPTKAPPNTPEAMLSPGQAAQVLGIHVNTIRRWSGEGVLKAYRVGSRGDRRFKRVDVETLLTEISPKDRGATYGPADEQASSSSPWNGETPHIEQDQSGKQTEPEASREAGKPL